MAIKGLEYSKKVSYTVDFDSIFALGNEVRDFNFHKGQR